MVLLFSDYLEVQLYNLKNGVNFFRDSVNFFVEAGQFTIEIVLYSINLASIFHCVMVSFVFSRSPKHLTSSRQDFLCNKAWKFERKFQTEKGNALKLNLLHETTRRNSIPTTQQWISSQAFVIWCSMGKFFGGVESIMQDINKPDFSNNGVLVWKFSKNLRWPHVFSEG